MAYFPNGTSGEVLNAQCDECIHGKSDDIMCPVYLVQIHYNYDQCRLREKKLRQCLEYLVDKEGICQMKKALDNAGFGNGDEVDKSELQKWDEARKGP